MVFRHSWSTAEAGLGNLGHLYLRIARDLLFWRAVKS